MRFILVRPLGGLNDFLCQVGRGMIQAKFRRRVLSVDLTLNDRFPTNFFDFFQRADTNGLEVTYLDRPRLEHLAESVHPNGLIGRLADPTAWTVRDEKVVTAEGNQPITWPLWISNQRLIVHQQWGGGLLSLLTLNFFSPSDLLAKRVRERNLKGSSVSELNLHFRNTDYKSSVDVLKRFLDSNSSSQVRIFSDNERPHQGIPAEVEWVFKAPTGIPEKDLSDAILDVLEMSKASEFIPIPISHPSTPFSGFGLLARALWVFREPHFWGFMSRLAKSNLYFSGSGIVSWLKFWILVIPFFTGIWLSARFGRGTLTQWLDLY